MLLQSGSVKCWGLGNKGQLGGGKNDLTANPVDVIGLSEGVKEISSKFDHTCALMTDGTVQCWGANVSYQLGDGTQTNRYSPVKTIGLTGKVQAISAGRSHTCALMEDGKVMCWALSNSQIPPAYVPGFANMVSIASGENFVCGVTNQGAVQRFNGYSHVNIPPSPELTTGVRQIAVGYRTVCALMKDGTVFCWGTNDGILGDPFKINGTPNPMKIPFSNTNVVSITVGDRHACGLLDTGHIQCWGRRMISGNRLIRR